MARTLDAHPIAALFPNLNPVDFDALKEDIRRHGVKVPILLHGGQILDGRQRYRACQELGVRCPFVEWNGHDPWLEVQSRNLIRRQLAKEQVYAIRKLAAQRFPEIAAVFEAEKADAKARKEQAKGKPRGQKALLRSQDRHRESADAIGAQIGVSGTTVKRVDRLARLAPHLLSKVAAGQISVKRALREVAEIGSTTPRRAATSDRTEGFVVDRAAGKLGQIICAEYERCPREHRAEFIRAMQKLLQKLRRQQIGGDESEEIGFPRSMNDDDRTTSWGASVGR